VEEKNHVLPEIMDVQDLAEICRVSKQTIKDCIGAGKIPAYKLSRGCWLVSTKLFVRYIEKQSVTIPDNPTQSDTDIFNR